MAISIVSVSFATSVNNISTEDTITVIPSDDGHSWTFKSKQLPNGNACYYLLKDGQVFATSIVDKANQTITTTDNTNSEVETISYTPVVTANAYSSRASFITVGSIDYTYSGGGSTIRSGDISYRLNISPSHYDLNGNYKNAATIITLLISVLTLPEAAATSVVYTMLARLGIAISATSIFIPSYIVDCETYEMTWRAMFTNPRGPYGEVTGYKYIITQPGESGTYYKGDYNPPSAFRDKDKTLAKSLYENAFWSYDETYGTPVKWVAK